MGLKKGNTNNPNGRPKGTPNKATLEMKAWISTMLEKNKAQFEKDLKKVDPEKRLAIIEKLLQYVIPKQQMISLEAQIQAEYEELEKLLSKAPDEAVERIIERIEQIKHMQDEQQ